MLGNKIISNCLHHVNNKFCIEKFRNKSNFNCLHYVNNVYLLEKCKLKLI